MLISVLSEVLYPSPNHSAEVPRTQIFNSGDVPTVGFLHSGDSNLTFSSEDVPRTDFFLGGGQSSILKFGVPYCFTYISAPLCFTEMGLNFKHAFKMRYFPVL